MQVLLDVVPDDGCGGTVVSCVDEGCEVILCPNCALVTTCRQEPVTRNSDVTSKSGAAPGKCYQSQQCTTLIRVILQMATQCQEYRQ